MGVLRSPRVTSARGARGMQGLPQPGSLSPAPGERLRPGCLAAARILPQRWALSSGTGKGLWGQPRDREAKPPLATLAHPPPQGRALSATLQLEPRLPHARDGPRSILSQPRLWAGRARSGAGLDQTPCSSGDGMEQDSMDSPAPAGQWGQSMNMGQRMRQGCRDGAGDWGRTTGMNVAGWWGWGQAAGPDGLPVLRCPE